MNHRNNNHFSDSEGADGQELLGLEQSQTELLDQAQEWQVTLWSGEVTDQEQAAFNAWLNTSDQHQHAWQQLQRVSEQFAAVPDTVASRVLRSPVDKKRRNLLGLALLAGAGTIAYQVPQTTPWRLAGADYRTGRGEQLTVTLPDGTALTLNTATAVELQFNAASRQIYLHNGEVQVVTAPDTFSQARPFIVQTSAGSIKPIGTRFSVRQLNEGRAVLKSAVQVEVYEGAVDLIPRNPVSHNATSRLDAGFKSHFNERAAGKSEVIQPADGAWVKGLLVAERQSLGDFVAELNRYRNGIVRCDPAVKDIIVSGVYPINNIDAVLRSLEKALPVRVQSFTPYWVTITTP